MTLEALESYQWPPSNEIIARRVGLDPSEILRFDGNVAPAPPASARPAAIARALADINEYDRGRYEPLRSAIAQYHGVEMDNVVLGAGSDEFIVLLARLFAQGASVATVPAFSYSMYRYAASMAGAHMVDDPARADLVFVCRPNNPTGEMVDIPEVPGQIVVDEAYADYAGVSAISRINEGLVVLRTFSKAFGLAGARVGYALGEPSVIRAMSSYQAPLSVSAPSAALALVALQSPPDVAAQITERERMRSELLSMGLDVRVSHTNFLFLDVADPESIVERLLPYGTVVRAYPGGVRISVRDQIDNDVLLDAWGTEFLGKEASGRRGQGVVSSRRITAETRMHVRLRVWGEGRVLVSTGDGFYDHMLQQLAFHGGMDLDLVGVGDLETGDHHTVEDMMRAFGDSLSSALGDRKGIARYGESRVPMDEAVAHAVVDLSGRPVANINIEPDPGMAAHALESFVQAAGVTLHVTASGRNAHHVAEATFKAVGRAIAQATSRNGTLIRSTKGSL